MPEAAQMEAERFQMKKWRGQKKQNQKQFPSRISQVEIEQYPYTPKNKEETRLAGQNVMVAKLEQSSNVEEESLPSVCEITKSRVH